MLKLSNCFSDILFTKQSLKQKLWITDSCIPNLKTAQNFYYMKNNSYIISIEMVYLLGKDAISIVGKASRRIMFGFWQNTNRILMISSERSFLCRGEYRSGFSFPGKEGKTGFSSLL